MAEFKLTEGTQFEYESLPADSVLEAEVVDVTVEDSFFWVDDNDHSKGKKQQVSFRFRVTDGEYAGRNFWGNTPTYFDSSPNCRLRVWVEELLGADELPVGFSFDTDMLVGAPCRIVLGLSKKGKNFVSDVMRAKESVTAAAPASAGPELRPAIMPKAAPDLLDEPF